MTTVFLVAPTPLMRAGLRGLLTTPQSTLALPEIEIVGETASLPGDLAGVAVLVVANEELLTDETAQVLLGNRGLAVVVLTENERFVNQLRIWRLRGWAVVSPDAPAAELQAAVKAAANGLVVLPEALIDRLFEQRGHVLVEAANFEPDLLQESLTSREQEVLELLSQGLSNKMMARQLNISEHTVKFHISALYAKLGTSNRAETVSRGARLGLISF